MHSHRAWAPGSQAGGTTRRTHPWTPAFQPPWRYPGWTYMAGEWHCQSCSAHGPCRGIRWMRAGGLAWRLRSQRHSEQACGWRTCVSGPGVGVGVGPGKVTQEPCVSCAQTQIDREVTQLEFSQRFPKPPVVFPIEQEQFGLLV